MMKMLLACVLVITVVGYVLVRASAVYALVDLVSAPSAEAAEQILNNIKQQAEAVGGNTVVVSRVLALPASSRSFDVAKLGQRPGRLQTQFTGISSGTLNWRSLINLRL